MARRAWIASLAAGALAALLAAPAQANPGDLDNTFGTGGKFILGVGPQNSQLNAAAVQSDGKIVAVGFANQSATSPNNADVEVLRLNANGTPDAGFGSGGVVTTPISAGTANDFASGVVIDPTTNKIYVAITTDPPSGSDFSDAGVACYTPTGTLCSDFGGGDGIVTASTGNTDVASGIVLWNGMPTVVGFDAPFHFAVYRFTANGSGLDTTFNPSGSTPGELSTSFGGAFDGADSAAVTSDGKLLVAGTKDLADATAADIALEQVNTDGTLDTAGFGGGTGKSVLSIPGTSETTNALALSGGKIYIGGEGDVATGGGGSAPEFFAARFNADGSADTGFSTDGFTKIPFDPSGAHSAAAKGIIVGSDGTVTLAGSAFIGCGTVGCAQTAWVRLTPQGDLDSTFGSGGTVTHDIGTSNDFANDAVRQPIPGTSGDRDVSFGVCTNASTGNDENCASAIQNAAAAPPSGCGGLTAEVVMTPNPSHGRPGTTELSVEAADSVQLSVRVHHPAGTQCNVHIHVESGDFTFDRDVENLAQDFEQGVAAASFPVQLGRIFSATVTDLDTGEKAFASGTLNVYDISSGLNAPTTTGLNGSSTDRTGAKKRAMASAASTEGTIKKVQIAVLKQQKGLKPLKAQRCQWLTAKGSFKGVKPTGKRCDKPVWIEAKLGKTRKGKTPWSYKYRHQLGPGKYVAYARSTNAAGVTESVFKPKFGNERAFTVK